MIQEFIEGYEDLWREMKEQLDRRGLTVEEPPLVW